MGDLPHRIKLWVYLTVRSSIIRRHCWIYFSRRPIGETTVTIDIIVVIVWASPENQIIRNSVVELHPAQLTAQSTYRDVKTRAGTLWRNLHIDTEPQRPS
jgi:hypothetical protein